MFFVPPLVRLGDGTAAGLICPLYGWRFSGAVGIASVHCNPRLRDAIDHRRRFRVCRDKALEIALSQHQQSAIGQSHHVRLAPLFGQQRHFLGAVD
jgi:hypothetical protein